MNNERIYRYKGLNKASIFSLKGFLNDVSKPGKALLETSNALFKQFDIATATTVRVANSVRGSLLRKFGRSSLVGTHLCVIDCLIFNSRDNSVNFVRLNHRTDLSFNYDKVHQFGHIKLMLCRYRPIFTPK